ncbi:MAG: GlsB/YeaQ/YmgE family stress response membrane protein [Lachnospiraceae bacterium]|nr:GlsB/YeaQ/YmgE family stress response membrane protein [Lachnospiraceae bacterium]
MLHWVITLAICALCGFLAGCFMGGGKNGLLVNIILGLVGGFVGRFVFGLIGFSATNLIGEIISGVVGTCILIAVGRFFMKK